jgi:amidase
MNDVTFMTAHELAAVIRQRRVSAVEVLEAYLAQITRHNSTLNAIVTLDEDGARRRAGAADAALAQGEVWGPLHGVPITLKDIHDTAGLRSTMGTASFLDRLPSEDSTVAARLKAAGAILLGKTNVELFPDNPFGRSHNPWDLERTPGASSSGAAAGLAAGLTALDIGSDMGGSIIGPSHYCGVCGMRPTERRVPVGHIPLDPVPLWRVMGVLGPMGRSVADLRLALGIIAGPSDHDTEVPPLPLQQVTRPVLHDVHIAWASTFPGMHIAADIRMALEGFAQQLDRLGAHVEQHLPKVDFVEQAKLCNQLFELIVSAFGTPATSLGDYLTALHRRDAFIVGWEHFFEDWDVLLCPADVTTAPRLTQMDEPLMVDGEAVAPDEAASPCQLSPVTGHPAVVIPLAKDQNGLPIGVQVVGRRWDDGRLLAIAEILSEVTGGFQRPPGY